VNVIRFGSTHGSPSRYVDLLRDPNITKVLWIAREHDVMVEKVIEVCSDIEPTLIHKLEVFKFSPPVVVRYIGSIILRLAQNFPKFSSTFSAVFGGVLSQVLKKTDFNHIHQKINELDYDFTWSGNNDSDGINVLLWWFRLHCPDMPIVHSYQEHRCCYRLDEKMAIESADFLILPSERNMREFERLYSVDLSGRVAFANEDWRFTGLQEYVASLDVNKLSEIDGEPHVIILSRFAAYAGGIDRRRGSRINYIDIIRNFVEKGVHVHLNVLEIVKSIEEKICEKENPYFELAKEFPNHFHIDKALDLDDWGAYRELKSYDAGVLHNFVPGENVSLFSSMNVPNRLFEYVMCNVNPILLTGQMQDAEDLLKSLNFGIIERDYDSIASALVESVNSSLKAGTKVCENSNKYNFKRYVSVVLDSGRLAKNRRIKS